MFKQLFASMNEVLGEIIQAYPKASEAGKRELLQQVGMLKSMNDICVEQWLLFEEKLEQVITAWEPHTGMLTDQGEIPSFGDAFRQGLGYYHLTMYPQAICQFQQAVAKQPDFMLARLYLALGHMRSGHFAEAYRHFQLLSTLTEHHKMKAISYNAMGCIQAKNRNQEKAQEYFQMALQADPTFTKPLVNANLSIQDEEKLLFDSGIIM